MLENAQFIVSLRYELFYALNALLNPSSRLHPTWRRETLAGLPERFFECFAELGGAWELFAVMAATLPKESAQPAFAEIIAMMKAADLGEFKRAIIEGLIHTPAAVAPILEQSESLAAGLRRVPKQKREWLSYIGLYPFDKKAPLALALDFLLRDPAAFRRAVLTMLELFWSASFAATWQRLEPSLRRASLEKERLFLTCRLSEFFLQALIRVEVDEAAGTIRALRGGYEVAASAISRCYLMPSAFNDRRYWSSLGESDPPVIVYFPFFEPALLVDPQTAASDPAHLALPELDPALIFKALGDTTRFALTSLLAKRPQTAVELAAALGISKPTVSHHVNLLREAGLLTETYAGGAVRLAVNRSVLEGLSGLVVARLFESDAPPSLRRSRRKS